MAYYVHLHFWLLLYILIFKKSLVPHFLISCTVSIFILCAIGITCFFYETVTITKTSAIKEISEITIICPPIQNCVPQIGRAVCL